MRLEDVNAKLSAKIPNIEELFSAFLAEHPDAGIDHWITHLRDRGSLDKDDLTDAEFFAVSAHPLPATPLIPPGPSNSPPVEQRLSSLSLAGMTMTTEGMDEDELNPSPEDSQVGRNKIVEAIGAPPAPPTGVRTATPGISTGPTTSDQEAAAKRQTRLEQLRQRTPSLPPQAPLVAAKRGDDRTLAPPPDVPGRGYKFVGKIGEGAMGEILIAKDLDVHRTVAYKVMSESIAEQPSLASKFYGEAQITAQLDHPNIVPVYQLTEAPNGTLAYTMKLIRGQTFEKLIEETRERYQKKTLDDAHNLATRLDQFLKVCDAMHYAHSRGVVHRDLKPENIMLGAFGEVYVMDWGIARLFEIEGARREDLVLVEGYQESETLADSQDGDDDDGGMIIGTPQYMSPEQAHGRGDLDGRSDQYALGLILWELVSLRKAVTGKSPLKIVMRQQDGDKDPLLHAYGEPIAPELKSIIEKSTSREPKDRYANVHLLADDVRRFLRGEAVLARPDTPRQRVMRWVGRNRELTLSIVFFLIMVSGGVLSLSLGWSFYSQSRARQHEQHLTQLLTSTSAQAAEIDGYMNRFQGLLGIIGASATEMLVRGEMSNAQIYYSTDFGIPEKAPKDLSNSRRYGVPISVTEPVFAMAPNTDFSQIENDLKRLLPLERYLRRVLLLSKDEDAANFTPARAAKLISDSGTPIAWAQIGLASGGYVGFPGQTLPEKFDPRNRPWYKLGKESKKSIWGSPYIDPGSQGLLLPCAMPLYDASEKPQFIGVAAVDLTFDFIIDKLLVGGVLPKTAESFLVDDQGRIVVRSSERGKQYEAGGRGNRSIRMPEFPVPEVVKEIRAMASGELELWDSGQKELIVYTRLNSLGWYYIVRGTEGDLLAD